MEDLRNGIDALRHAPILADEILTDKALGFMVNYIFFREVPMYSIFVKDGLAQAKVGSTIIAEATFVPGDQESYSAAMDKCSAAINAYNERGL